MDLVLGTMYFGTRLSERDSFAQLDAFVAAGGRILDTADAYSFWSSPTGQGGQSEEVIGRWLASNPGLRDELTIATKVGVEPTPDGLEGLAAGAIARAIDGSLSRLGIDHVDLYWAHAEDRSVELAETVAALGALVSDGRVRRLGVSNHATWRVERARTLAESLGVEPYTALQLHSSYVDPRPWTTVPGKDHRFGWVSDETIDYLDDRPELELWVYSPLVQGAFDRADRALPEVYDHPGTTRRLAALRSVAAARGVPASQVVLAWMTSWGWRPIVGVSSLEQLGSALASADLELTPEELRALDLPR